MEEPPGRDHLPVTRLSGRARRGPRRVAGRAAPVSHRQAAFRTATKDRIIPLGVNVVEVALADRTVTLTNLLKPFWPRLGLTKGDLLQYYVEVAPVLLPHLRDRAMVMKRYPNGAAGPFFFMKRAPTPRPSWIEICSIAHGSRGVIDFPMIQDLASRLGVIKLGRIDLNRVYARGDEIYPHGFRHF